MNPGSILQAAAAAFTALLVASTAQAQVWPQKQPIHLVAVFPPGGSVDQVARILSQPLRQRLGQTVRRARADRRRRLAEARRLP